MEHNNIQQPDSDAQGKRTAQTRQEQTPAAPFTHVLNRLGLPLAWPGKELAELHLLPELASAERPAESTAAQALEGASLERLTQALQDGHVPMRMAAIQALSRQREHLPIEPLLAALHDPAWQVRALAALTLRQAGERVPVTSLVDALHDEDESVRAAAARALGVLGERAPVQALEHALHDSSWRVREAAVLTAGELSKRVPTEWFFAAANDRNAAVRESALLVLQSSAPASNATTTTPKQSDQGTGRSVNAWRATSSTRRLSRRALLLGLAVAVVIAVGGIAWPLVLHSLQQRHAAQTATAYGPIGLPFYGPGYSVVDAQGNLYVLDADLANTHTRVLKLSPSGGVLAAWHPFPSGDPLSGIAVSREGDLYVSVQGEDTIYHLSPAGTVLTKWNLGGQVPAGLAVDSSGNVYVALLLADTIQKYSPMGTLLAVWGEPGTALGQFRQPTELALDRQGALYVVDAGNTRVQKLSLRGVPLLVWGTLGKGPGQFLSPGALAVDGQGDVYVTDGEIGRVQKFSPAGKLLATWGNTQALQFSIPRGVAVNIEGTIYVSSVNSDGARFADGRITQLSPSGKVLAVWR